VTAIAVVNKSTRLKDDFLAFACKAADAQVIECANAYGVTATPVAFYAREAGLPARDCRILALVDDIEDGLLGFHSFEMGVVYSRVLAMDQNATSACLSHECLEELLDPYCNKWRPMPGGRSVAYEICDPVQRDTYAVKTEILGESRQIVLSNYVLPRWFDPAAQGNFDRLAKLQAPFAMSDGGYLIVRDRAGSVTNVFAQPRIRASTAEGHATVGRKLANSESRTSRRLRG
jgi:hypothetical protein